MIMDDDEMVLDDNIKMVVFDEEMVFDEETMLLDNLDPYHPHEDLVTKNHHG